jgi:N-acetyltransferase
VGCLVAEPIKAAHKVIPSSSSEDRTDLLNNKTESTQANHTLEFGKISFKREVLRRHNHADKNKEESQGPGAIICEEHAVPALCGFRAIWVVPSRRRKGIGSQLMDAARYDLQAPFHILLALMLVTFSCLDNSSLSNMTVLLNNET